MGALIIPTLQVEEWKPKKLNSLSRHTAIVEEPVITPSQPD